jgi:hypothetical protein
MTLADSTTSTAAEGVELERQMALVEKSQQLAGHFPDADALGRARRVLTGDTTAAAAYAELDAQFPRA